MRIRQAFEKIIPAAVAALYIAAMVIALNTESEDMKLSETKATVLDSGWTDYMTGEEITECRIEVAPGEQLGITRTLPDDLNNNRVIGYYDFGFQVMVFVDGEKIFERGRGIDGVFGKETNPVWKTFQLKEEYSGKKMTILFQNDGDKTLLLNLDHMFIANASTILLKVLQTSAPTIILVFLAIVISGVLATFDLIVWFSGYRENARRISPLVELTAVMTVWSYANCNLFQIYSGDASWGFVLASLMYMLTPAIIAEFVYRAYDGKYAVYRYLKYGSLLTDAGCVILALTNAVSLNQSIFMIHILLNAIAIIALERSIVDFRRTRSSADHWGMIGFFILVFLCGGVTVTYYMASDNKTFIYGMIIYLAFLLAMVAFQCVYAMNDYISKRKKAEYDEIARIDVVTGGKSRYAAEKYITEYDFHYDTVPKFMIIELTDFPDTYAFFAWQHGKEMVKGAFETIKGVLGDDTFIARVDDYLFCAVLPPDTDTDMLSAAIREAVAEYFKNSWNNVKMRADFFLDRVQPGDSLEKLMVRYRLYARTGNSKLTSDFTGNNTIDK